MVLTDPADCADVPVLFGPEADRCIDERAGKDADAYLLGVPRVNVESENGACVLAIRKFQRKLPSPNDFYQVIFGRPGRPNYAPAVAHEYAHWIFRNHPNSIRPNYVPRPDAPVMTDSLIEDVIQDEIQRNTPVGQSIKSDPASFKRDWNTAKRYHAQPKEEFAFGFMLLEFHEEHQGTRTLQDYIDSETSEERLPDGTIVTGQLDPVVIRYYELLWERFVKASP